MTEQEEFEFRLRLEQETPATAAAPKAEASMAEYLWNKAKTGLSNLPAMLTAGGMQQQGTFAGAFPTQPELETTPGAVQKKIANVRDVAAPEMNVPGFGRTAVPTKAMGAGMEAMADPLSYFGGGSLLSRMGSANVSGMFGELGGEAGGATEKALFGQETGVGRALGGVTGAVGAPLAGAPFRVGVEATTDVGKQLWSKYKTVKIDPAAAEDAVAAGATKRILEQAAKSTGFADISALTSDIQKASLYVTGEKAPLFFAAAENPVLRAELQRLARTNPEVRGRLDEELKQIALQIDSKADKIFGGRYAAAGGADGLKATNAQARIRAIDNQLEKIASRVDVEATRAQVGKAAENLIESKKKAVKAEIGPEYEGLKQEARDADVKMPAEATESLYTFVEANNLQDIFGRGTSVGNKIMRLLKPRETPVASDPNIIALERAAGISPETNRVFSTLSFDDVDSLKSEINRLQRVVREPTQQKKLMDLETQLSSMRDEFIPEWSNRLKEIDTKYYERLGVPFGAQGVRDIDSAKYATNVAPIIVKNTESLTDFLKVAGDQGIPIANNAMMARAYDAATKGGEFNAKALANFLGKKEVKDVLNMLPETKQTLLASITDDRVLRSAKARLDVAATAAEKRIADNWITQKEPDFSTLATKFMSNAKDREKLLRDLKDVSPETSKAVLNSLRREIAQKAMQSESAFGYLTSPANKNALNAAMGSGYQEKLQLIAKMADNLKKTNVDNLNIQLTQQQTDALGSVVKGLDIPFVTSTLRDRISSNTQKVVRLLSRINVSQIKDKADEQLISVLFDRNGVDKLAKMSTDLNFKIKNPLDLKKLQETFLNNIPSNVYIGLQATEEEQ